MTSFRAVFFDFGGTLFSYTAFQRAMRGGEGKPLFAQAADRLGVDVDRRTIGKAYGKASATAFQKFTQRFPYLEIEALHSKELNRLMTKAMSKQDMTLYAQAPSLADAKVASKMYQVYKKVKFKNMIRDADDSLHWHAWKWSFIGAIKASDKRNAKKILKYLVEQFEADPSHKSDVQRMRANYENM